MRIITDLKHFDLKSTLRITLGYNFVVIKKNSDFYCQNEEWLKTNKNGLENPQNPPYSSKSALNWRKILCLSSSLNTFQHSDESSLQKVNYENGCLKSDFI